MNWLAGATKHGYITDVQSEMKLETLWKRNVSLESLCQLHNNNNNNNFDMEKWLTCFYFSFVHMQALVHCDHSDIYGFQWMLANFSDFQRFLISFSAIVFKCLFPFCLNLRTFFVCLPRVRVESLSVYFHHK